MQKICENVKFLTSKGCSCKGNCSSRRCKCSKEHKSCKTNCKCIENPHKNGGTCKHNCPATHDHLDMNVTDQEMIDKTSHTQGNDIDENEITSDTDKSDDEYTSDDSFDGASSYKTKKLFADVELISMIAIQNHQQYPTVLKMMLKKFLESLMILTLTEYNSEQTKFMLFLLIYSTHLMVSSNKV